MQNTADFLCFQKSNVLVNCGSADVADPCEFRHIQLLAFVCGVVAKERCGDVLFAHLRSADLSPFGSGVLHATTHSRPNHRQFELRLTRRIALPAVIMDRNG